MDEGRPLLGFYRGFAVDTPVSSDLRILLELDKDNYVGKNLRK